MIRLVTRRRHPGSPDDKLIPMINVIFLLLLFFMIAGHISSRFGEELLSPVSRSEAMTPATARELVLAADGTLSLGGERLATAALAARLARAGAAREGIRLRADARVSAARLLPVLAALREAGIERVALVTLRRSTPAG